MKRERRLEGGRNERNVVVCNVLTPRIFPDITATIPERKEPKALDRTENHT